MISRRALTPIASLVVACDFTAPAPVADVSISPASIDIGLGGTRQLEATILDVSGGIITGRSITWTSSETGVAAVSVSGLVTAKALGVTTVTAAVDGFSGTVLIRVPAQQEAMDEQVAHWVERAIGYELYNGYVVKTPNGTKNISSGCPHGGSVVITGSTTPTSQTQRVDLLYRTDACRVNTTTGELSLTGRVSMSGSWSLADRLESIAYAAADSATISGTARLADGTLFSVGQKCALAITRSTTASAEASTLSGIICGRSFSR